MQKLQIFKEFTWLVHVGILDVVYKKIQGVRWTINNLPLRVNLILRQIFVKTG